MRPWTPRPCSMQRIAFNFILLGPTVVLVLTGGQDSLVSWVFLSFFPNSSLRFGVDSRSIFIHPSFTLADFPIFSFEKGTLSLAWMNLRERPGPKGPPALPSLLEKLWREIKGSGIYIIYFHVGLVSTSPALPMEHPSPSYIILSYLGLSFPI